MLPALLVITLNSAPIQEDSRLPLEQVRPILESIESLTSQASYDLTRSRTSLADSSEYSAVLRATLEDIAGGKASHKHLAALLDEAFASSPPPVQGYHIVDAGPVIVRRATTANQLPDMVRTPDFQLFWDGQTKTLGIERFDYRVTLYELFHVAQPIPSSPRQRADLVEWSWKPEPSDGEYSPFRVRRVDDTGPTILFCVTGAPAHLPTYCAILDETGRAVLHGVFGYGESGGRIHLRSVVQLRPDNGSLIIVRYELSKFRFRTPDDPEEPRLTIDVPAQILDKRGGMERRASIDELEPAIRARIALTKSNSDGR